jgi:hypothetical protein
VTAGIPETYGSVGPWQRYVAKERAARGAYLATVERAHHEYLTGPWPDREAYQHVEHSAWLNYYQAGRDAWRYYTRELEPPPPPPLPIPYPDGLAPAFTPGDQFDQRQETYLAADPNRRDQR